MLRPDWRVRAAMCARCAGGVPQGCCAEYSGTSRCSPARSCVSPWSRGAGGQCGMSAARKTAVEAAAAPQLCICDGDGMGCEQKDPSC